MKKNILSFKLISSIGILSLFFVMALPVVGFFGNTENDSENFHSELAGATLPAENQNGSDYRNLSLNPGANVEEMRFTWHSGHENTTLVIENPDGNNWELVSQGRPVEAHGGVGVMGDNSNMLPTRPGYIYYIHQVAVYDLSPEQSYTYFIEWDDDRSTNKTFRTGGSDSFQFLIAGDPQIGAGEGLDAINTPESAIDGARWRQTLDIATAAYPNSEFILSLGDQVQSSNSNAADPNKHVEISQFRYDEMFSSEHLHSLPLLAVAGNHDGWTFDDNNANIRLWPMHYNIPAPDEARTRGGVSENVFRHRDEMYTQFDYWVRWGDVLFFVLDANGQNDGVHRVMNSERLAFLEDAVSQNADATWRVATFHHPAYSVYRMSHIDEIQQIINNFLPHFERLDFDIVLNGHAHVYSRSHHMLGNEIQDEQRFLDADANIVAHETNAVLNPNGIAHLDFNSASGSGFYNVAAMPRSYITAYNQNFHRNFSVADVTPDTFSVRTYQINDDDTHSLVDVYTIVRADENDDVPESVTSLPQMDIQTFERITQPDEVTVPHGIEATPEAFGLPETVGIETNLFNNVSGNVGNVRPPTAQSAPHSYGLVVRTPRAAVTWDIEGSDFDPDEGASQTFFVRGTVDDLPASITNPENLPQYVDIEVTVLSEGIVLPGDITRWMQYPPSDPNHASGMEAYFVAQGGINARVPKIEPTYGDAAPLQFFVGDTTRNFQWNAGAPTVVNVEGTGPGGLDNLTDPAFWHTSFSTKGRAGIQVEFNFRSDPAGSGVSNNGPRDWQLEFSLDNEEWAPAGMPITLTGAWNNNIVRNLPEMADDQETVYLRWRMASDIAVGGGVISPTARNHMRDIRIRSTRVLGEEEVACAGYQCIDVLMFNDFHGHIEAAEPVPENPGAAKLTAFIQHQRYQNPEPSNVIVVSGGDDFHGYSVATMTDGNPSLDMMGYLAEHSPAQQESGIHIALGNHEFSFGATRAREIGLNPNVTLLAADLYNAAGAPGERPDFILPYDIVEFPEHDITIALVGLMTSNMHSSVSGWGTLDLEARTPAPNNPDEYTQEIAELIEYLRVEEGVGAVIGLTHMGGNHESTTYIAENLDFDGIVGGHIHQRVHRRVNGTPIIEAAHAGRALGRFRLVFDENGELQGDVESWLSDSGEIENFTRPIAHMHGVSQYYDEMSDIVQGYLDDTYDELRGPRGPHGVYFSNRAERDVWVSRLVVDYVERWAEEHGEPTDWIGISNGGGWRNTGFWPRNADEPTTKAELISTMPFDNNILLFRMHGQDVLSLLNAPGLVGSQVRSGIHQNNGNWYVTATGERILNDRSQEFNVIGSNFIFGGIGIGGGDNYPWPGNTNGDQMGMQVLDPDGPKVLMIDGSTMSWNELQELSTAPADWVGLGVSMLRDALVDSSTFRRDTPNEEWQAELVVTAGTGGSAAITSPYAPENRMRNTNIIPQWVTVEATPTEGYNFAGWYDSSNENATLLSEEATFGFTITEDTTLEARFTPGEFEPMIPLTVEEARATSAGETITVSGIVTTNYAPGVAGNAFFLQSPTGITPESGILVRVNGATASQLVPFVGREVVVTGVRNGNVAGNGFVGLENITVATVANIDNIGPATIPDPVSVTFDQLRNQEFQSMLVTVVDPVTITSRTTGSSADPNRVVDVNRTGGGNFVVWPDPVAGGFDVDDDVVIERAVIHWWQSRNEVQFRLIDPANDLTLYEEEPDPEPEPDTFMLELARSPQTGSATDPIRSVDGDLVEGETVTITAGEPSQGYRFVRFDVSGAGATITDLNTTSRSATFTMGTENAAVTAVYELDLADEALRAELQDLITSILENYIETNYTETSWEALQNAITAAQETLTDENATTVQVQAAIDALETARDSLEPTAPIDLIVTFEAGDNGTLSANTALDVQHGQTLGANATIPKPTANTNFVFVHWISDAHTGSFTTDEIRNLIITTDTTFTAVFEEVSPTFTLELVRSPQTGSATDPTRSVEGDLVEGETVTITADEPSQGYRFVRFDVSGAGATVTDLNTAARSVTFTMGTENATVTAVYELDLADEVLRAELQNLIASILDNYIETDYTETSWEALQNAITAAQETLADENATTVQVQAAIDALETARNNLELNPDPIILRVTFEAGKNGTLSANASLDVQQGQTLGANAIIPKPTANTNFTFVHWTSNAHSGSFTTDEIRNLEITTDTIFTAVFEEISVLSLPTFTLGLTRSPRSGSATDPTRSGDGDLVEGETVTITAGAPRQGYRFVRFDVSGAGATVTDLNKTARTVTFTMGTEDATVTAVYERISISTPEGPTGSGQGNNGTRLPQTGAEVAASLAGIGMGIVGIGVLTTYIKNKKTNNEE